ncbi:MAG TPA: hypothetical protein VHX44_10955 [Planctomycetota bacterium]|jgi:hypothetical protein|nr:hypothetical protein [Planctomycetota bacterium]
MTDPKVRIGGDAGGATRATDQTTKGLKGVGDQAQKTGKQAKDAAEQAAQAEKKYEAAVQSAIQKIKNKEAAANATTEALKRLGKAEASAGGAGPSSRRMFMGGMPGGDGGPGGGLIAAKGLSRLGGATGGAFSAVSAGLAAGAPALAALGVAAIGLKVGFDALIGASEAHAKIIGETVKLEQQHKDAVEAATKQLAATALGASAEGGGALREAVARGASVAGIQGLADRTGLNVGQAAQVTQVTSGLDDQSKKVIEQAVRDAVRLGVDPVKTAEALRDSSKGGLGDMSQESALRNAGNLFDNFSGPQLQGGGEDLDRLAKYSEFSTRDSRAALKVLGSDAGLKAADSATAESARRTADPVTAALGDLKKSIDKEIDVLDAMAKGEHPLVRALNDLTASMRGGAGSYAGQARQQRAIANAAGM